MNLNQSPISDFSEYYRWSQRTKIKYKLHYGWCTGRRFTSKARTEPNQTKPTEFTEPAQPNLRKLTDIYDYRYRVLAPLPIRILVFLTSSSLIIIIIIIIIIRSIIITLK